jgi:hypothetical protein
MSAEIIQFAPRPHRERREMEFSTIASRSAPQPDDLTMDHVDTSPGECVWPDSRERQIADARSLTELRADFQHLRRWRRSVEQAQSYTFKAVITIIVSGFVGAVWLGVKVMLGK